MNENTKKYLQLAAIAIIGIGIALPVCNNVFNGTTASQTKAAAAAAAAAKAEKEKNAKVEEKETPPVATPESTPTPHLQLTVADTPTTAPTTTSRPKTSFHPTSNAGNGSSSSSGGGGGHSGGGGGAGGGSGGGGGGAGSSSATAGTQNVEGKYWLETKTNLRHNSTCPKFRNVEGRDCSSTEGNPCPICGG